MSAQINQARRRFLTQSALGIFAYASMPSLLNAMQNLHGMPKMQPKLASPNFNPDVEFELHCKLNAVPILPGEPTQVMQYSAKLLKGPKDTLTEIPGSYLGPIIRLQKGQKVRVRLHNHLAEPTITHWHGLHVPSEMDGGPAYVIDHGVKFVYEFEVLNRASMNIYHPHPHEATARQVYQGLAGTLFVHDEEEAALGLPSGEYEVPIVIQDRLFSENNQLIYARSMHDRMMGFYGDRILVNGKPQFKLEVASRAYRLRILNGSTARIYKLAWDDGTPITAIGVDGGLLTAPETKPYVMLAPGERLDVWADFSGRSVGSQLVMRSAAFSGVLPKMAERMMRGGMGGGMMGGMMHANALPVGSQYPIFSVQVTKKVSDSPKLPSQLSKITRYQLLDTVNPNHPVPIGISEAPMAMLLNGRPYAFNDFLPIEKIPLNSIQLLEIFHAHGGQGGHGKDVNSNAGATKGEGQHDMAAMNKENGKSTHATNTDNNEKSGGMQHGMMGGMGSMGGMGRHGGMGMGMRHENSNSNNEMGGMMGGMGGMGGGMGMSLSMAHPIHLHGQSFQIVSRNTSNTDTEDYATVRDGFINSGWKDTVLVMPGESVRIIKPFQDFKGPFMYHCHNLEHEDMGMMREFLVE